MVAAQLSGEEAQQNLRTGDLITSVYCRNIVETNRRFSKTSLIQCIYKLANSFFNIFFLQAMVIINGFLYVFGGTTGYIYSTDLHRLDLTTREWIHLKPNNPPDDLPEERYDFVTPGCDTS